MVDIEMDTKREVILQTHGHILIQGGPGCGKTTVALIKAKRSVPLLRDEQRVLFLSFSRAAVRQVTDRMSGILTPADREVIEVKTFHSFFLDIIRSHGRLLTGSPISFITPEREAQRRADHSGEWAVEILRLAREDSVFVFDTLAPFAAELTERSKDVRGLYSARYPLIIVDEFQDTNRDQWRVIKALSGKSTIVCLADPDQRIFDHIEGVDEHRLTELQEVLRPTLFDLSDDNHRSPSRGLLDYANAILRKQPADMPDNIIDRRYQYQPSAEAVAHWAVVAARDALTKHLGGTTPTIAVLTRTNVLAGRISETLSEKRVSTQGEELLAVDHVLAWDPELAAASALVIASILEWPTKQRSIAVASTLRHMADYYRTKLGNGTQGARTTITTLERAIAAVELERNPTSKSARLLLERFDASSSFVGQPVRDWQSARARLTGSTELDEIFRQARLVRLLRATDVLAWALLDAWDGLSSYHLASEVVRTALANEAVETARNDPPPVSVMTMHKSKGKEFDGVIIVEGRHQGQLLSENPKQNDADRRLLRVAITRARTLVILIRPLEVGPLTPPLA
jgi:DNA helicase-2/ATP-dependent DNA helicase PcrA